MDNNNDSDFDSEVEIPNPEQERERQPTRSASVLEKIKALLASTKADKWQQWGEPLDESKKHQRPIEVWEQSYSIDTRAGVLALRSVVPITCNFFGGGYSYSHAGRPKYMVELRPRGWSPRMPAEVANRVNASGEKNYQVLADGEIARALFSEVEYNVRNFRDTLRVDFNDSVHRLAANCLEQVQATIASDWRVLEGEEGYLGYSGDVHGLTLTVALVQRGSMKHYSMYCTKHGYRWDCRDSNLIQDVFSHVDEIVRTASLEHLGKVLEEML